MTADAQRKRQSALVCIIVSVDVRLFLLALS